MRAAVVVATCGLASAAWGTMSITAATAAGVNFKSASDTHWHNVMPTGSYTHTWNDTVDGAAANAGSASIGKPSPAQWENATGSNPFILSFPLQTASDSHGCVANSSATVHHWYTNPPGGSRYYHRGIVQAYAQAGVAPGASASAVSQLEDPWAFTRPLPEEAWDLWGEAALDGMFGDSLAAGVEWAYTLTTPSGTSPLWTIHLGITTQGVRFADMNVSPGVSLMQGGAPVTPAALASQLNGFFGPGGWSAPTPPGDDLQSGFRFDWFVQLPASVGQAQVDYRVRAAAYDAVPEPGVLALAGVGLCLLARRRR